MRFMPTNRSPKKTADLKGVMQVFNGTHQIYPTSMEDVAGFKVE